MTSQRTVKTLLILGASGDLTGRLLLPGLARLVARGHAEGLMLVGAGSDPWTAEQWHQRVDQAFAAAVPIGRFGHAVYPTARPGSA